MIYVNYFMLCSTLYLNANGRTVIYDGIGINKKNKKSISCCLSPFSNANAVSGGICALVDDPNTTQTNTNVFVNRYRNACA